MTFDEYQHRAMRTANKLSKKWSNAGLGIAGEAGEVADIIKKYLHHGHDLDVEELEKELGDVLWYVALVCEMLSVSMSEIATLNIEKLKKRYPDGFSVERSIHREE